MKQYVLSVRPGWARLILNGDKLADVRLTRPKEPVHEDTVVWLYETKRDGGRGRIVGRCRVPEIRGLNIYKDAARREAYARLSCLSGEQLEAYQTGHRFLYFWLIEEARELSEEETPTLAELGVKCPPVSWCSVKDLLIKVK